MISSNQIITVPFHSTVAANSNKTLVSRKLSFPFMTRKIIASFMLNTNNLLTLQYFISGSDAAPTTSPPDGVNLLSLFGHVGYITGDDSDFTLEHEFEIDTYPSYLKIYAVNSDAFEHTILSFVEIEVMEFK